MESIITQPLLAQSYFAGRTLVVASRHEKEKVLAPILEQQLGVQVQVAAELDTDHFGTFSGERERLQSPLETARLKCIKAHEQTGEPLIIASEGSFGAHPVMGFIPANEEILLLKDFANDLEIKTKVLSTQTNFMANTFDTWEDVLYFAVQANFPSHGLIVRPAKDNYTEIHKGITDWTNLKDSFYHFLARYSSVYIETDMRALYNPARMKVIAQAAEKLVTIIRSTCPVCESPGFDVQQVIRGLPCSQCNTPTRSPRGYVYQCTHCHYEEERVTKEQKQKEDPMFCDHCNP